MGDLSITWDWDLDESTRVLFLAAWREHYKSLPTRYALGV